MKRILFFLLLLPIFAQAQDPYKELLPVAFPVDEASGEVTYTEAVTLDGVAASDLVQRASRWLNSAYHDRPPQTGQRPDGTLFLEATRHAEVSRRAAKGSLFGKVDDIKVRFSFRVEARDGQYRFMFTEFRVPAPAGNTAFCKLTEDEACYAGTEQEKFHDSRTYYWNNIRQNLHTQMLQSLSDLKAALTSGTSSAPAFDSW